MFNDKKSNEVAKAINTSYMSFAALFKKYNLFEKVWQICG
jgi:hypothetical protein